MTIALTGATGFVGQAVLDEASRKGDPVRALTRRDQASRNGVEWVRGDLADKAALARLVKGCEAVIHVAGVVRAPDKEGFEAGNVTGTMNLVEACVKAGIPRFILVSSLSAREPHLSLYGGSKRRGEQVVAASGLDYTIIRPPAVYGPRDGEMLDLFKAARWRVVPMPAEGAASYIHVEDLARLLLAIVPSGEAVTGKVFEPDDGRSGGWPHGEFGAAIGEAVGVKAMVPGLPRSVLELAARADEAMRGKDAKITSDRAAYMSHPDWVASEGRKVPSEIWQPRITTRDGLKATAEWYRNGGWL